MTKLEKILFYLFLFLIPFQIRIFLYNTGNEWDSMFLYLGDLVLIAVLVLRVYLTSDFRRLNLLLLIFLVIAGLSIFISTDSGISIYRFIKLLEFVLLYVYVSRTYKSYGTNRTYMVLIAAGLLQSALAITQFFKQSSLGIKFIEAGQYLPGAPGVATFVSGTEKIMRAYGSFPHPNVLAGFLLLAIFCFYALWLKNKKISCLLVTCYLLLVFSLFLTFSRGPILVFLIMSLVMFLFYLFRIRNFRRFNLRQEVKPLPLFAVFIFSVIISTAILFPYLKARFFTISLEEEAIDLRFFYNKIALSMIKDKPLLGVGIGNFVNYSENYPAFLRAALKLFQSSGPSSEAALGPNNEIPNWIYQPVHNIYLLIAAEMGIIGLVVFLLFIATQIIQIVIRMTRMGSPLFFLLISFLILGLTDHYFWTLQSGGLIFWLALGLTRTNDQLI